jgi:two-component system, chemotaxis family, chemotaxis protein CheY
MERTVVIVDDSPFIADLLAGFFEDKLGFRVAARGTNGFQAVALYKQHRPDLITIDLTMPVKDGKTALKEILAEDPGARILMITSQMGPQIVECLKMGAAGYVEKPLRFDDPGFAAEFETAIRTALLP